MVNHKDDEKSPPQSKSAKVADKLVKMADEITSRMSQVAEQIEERFEETGESLTPGFLKKKSKKNSPKS